MKNRPIIPKVTNHGLRAKPRRPRGHHHGGRMRPVISNPSLYCARIPGFGHAKFLLLSLLAAFCASSASAQITNVTNDQSTPTPGAGHDYVHLLSEIVNPSNGSVSIRIQPPMPKGRNLTIPFAFAYDSNGVHRWVPNGPTTGPGSVVWHSNIGYLSQGVGRSRFPC